MKVIFAIRGISNAGKSTTVKRVLALLLGEFPQAKWESYKQRRGRGDICGLRLSLAQKTMARAGPTPFSWAR